MTRRAGSPNCAATRRIDVRTATCRACGETFDYLLSGGKPERRYCSMRCHGIAWREQTTPAGVKRAHLRLLEATRNASDPLLI